MGINLKLLVSHFREHRGEILATASLLLDRDPFLLSQLEPDAQPCLVQRLGPGLRVGHYDEGGLRWDEVDRQGEPLTYTTPDDLGRIHLPDNLSTWNRAAMAFAFALPPQERIILYWC